MAEDEGLFFKFNAAGQQQHSKAGDEFLHNEKTMRAAAAVGKGKTCGERADGVGWRHDVEGQMEFNEIGSTGGGVGVRVGLQQAGL
jgi:hypothetical protein